VSSAKTTPAVDAEGRTLSDHEVSAVTVKPEGGRMKLVSYNIQYGLGKDGHHDLGRIAEAVADADIIALQEVERFWRRSGMVDQPAEIAGLLPDLHWVYGANLDMDASETDADGQPVHRRRQFGNMILSRLPIISSRNHLRLTMITTATWIFTSRTCIRTWLQMLTVPMKSGK
jgi:endonuclease/exonuclease/phosphatase family metal-dependent hydrolase